MADTIQSQDLQNQNKNQQNQQGQLGAPQTGVSAPGAGQTDNSSQGAQPVQSSVDSANKPGSQHQGSGFTNIQRVIGANQTNQLGSAVGGGVQQVGQQTQQAIGSSAQQTQQAQQAANLNTSANQAAIQQIIDTAGSSGAPSTQQTQQFQQYLSGQFTGPQNLQNAGQLQNQAQQAQQLGQMVGSAGGQAALLQRFAANPNTAYTQGQTTMDTALLGATGGKQLAQGRQATLGLNQQLGQAQTAAQASAQDLQAQAAGLKESTQNKLTGAEGDVNSALAKQMQDLPAQVKAQVAGLQDAFSKGQISADQLQQSGLAALAGQGTYGVDLGQYVHQGQLQATAANVASAEQAARLNALGALGQRGKLIDDSQAGSYQKQAIQGDLAAAQAAIANNKQAFAEKTAAAQQKLMADKQAAMIGGDTYGQNSSAAVEDLFNKYINAAPDQRNSLTKGVSPDQVAASLSHPGMQTPLNPSDLFMSNRRDQFVQNANDYLAQQAALQQLQQQYGGYTLPSVGAK